MLCCLALLIHSATIAQPKTELYDLLKKLIYDSTGYSNVGDWAVGNVKKFPVKWKEDRIVMSDDTAINFYRTGNVNISIGGKTFTDIHNQPVKWTIMLKGPRMGYTSFSIISTPSKGLATKRTIDSLLGNRPYVAGLKKNCDAKISGFSYHTLKLPKKDLAFVKFSWLTVNDNTSIRIDCYDEWSQYAAKLNCPK